MRPRLFQAIDSIGTHRAEFGIAQAPVLLQDGIGMMAAIQAMRIPGPAFVKISMLVGHH
jgi:hypothetical protein